jgi:regulator of protease activity HflC (stomatin/prohibitin superfamily)
MDFFSRYFVEILIIAIIAFRSIKLLKENERLVVFRAGRFLKIAGPGMVLIVPFIDRGIKVNLDKDIPGWQALSPMELEERMKKLVSDRSSSPGR